MKPVYSLVQVPMDAGWEDLLIEGSYIADRRYHQNVADVFMPIVYGDGAYKGPRVK